MRKIWSDDAWDTYLYWQVQDRKTLKRINDLIKDIERNGNRGIGKPEPLKHKHQGYWSRRIDEKNRLIYRIQNEIIDIIQCGSHYND
ncbi:Txe/YoeB family addiction module toxin [Spirochaetia bacterium]|nr:Txe/YoeB family addiction module toxin [Spirochaetia bacterium]